MCEVTQKQQQKKTQKLVAQVRQANKSFQANVSRRTINKNAFKHNTWSLWWEKTDEQTNGKIT